MSNLFSYYTQVIFIVFVVVNHFVEIYLTRRQLETYQKNDATPPAEFKHFISDEDHQKAIKYSTAKLKLSQWHLIYDAALLLSWFPFRGAEKLFQFFSIEGIHRDVMFLVLFGLIQFLFKVAETSLEKFQVDQQCLKCRGCRKQHPELKREYRKADDAKVEFIPVSSFSTADLRRLLQQI